jgi:hypothetical protein
MYGPSTVTFIADVAVTLFILTLRGAGALTVHDTESRDGEL